MNRPLPGVRVVDSPERQEYTLRQAEEDMVADLRDIVRSGWGEVVVKVRRGQVTAIIAARTRNYQEPGGAALRRG